MKNLKNELINYEISTILNATRVLLVSNQAENSKKARLFGLEHYFLPQTEKA